MNYHHPTPAWIALLASTSLGQGQRQFAPVPSPVKDAGTYVVATESWDRSGDLLGVGPDVLFRNDAFPAYFGICFEGESTTDEGRIPSSASVADTDVHLIMGFQIKYCAMLATPTTASITWFQGYAPCSDPILAGDPVLGAASLTGLPNGGCWLVTVDLSNSDLEFSMEGDGGDSTWDMDMGPLDSFGYQMSLDNDQGQTINAGFVIAGDYNGYGDGTKYINPGASDGTGLDAQDFFYLNSPYVNPGCYWYGSIHSSHYMIMMGRKVEGGESYCGDGSVNSVGPGAELTPTGGFGTSAATFDVAQIPNQPGVLFSGDMQDSLLFGCGTRCIGGQITRGPVLSPAGNSISTSFDMSLPNTLFIQYWYRDPSFASTCGDAFNLSNALRR